MNLHPATLAAVAQVAQEVREILGDDADAETIRDCVESETDAMDVMARLITIRAMAKAHEAAKRTLAAEIEEAARRDAAKAEAMADSLRALLSAMGVSSLRHPLALVTVRDGQDRLIITDKAAIPTQLRKPGEPDLTAIKGHLKAGEKVPGAEMAPGHPVLTVKGVK